MLLLGASSLFSQRGVGNRPPPLPRGRSNRRHVCCLRALLMQGHVSHGSMWAAAPVFLSTKWENLYGCARTCAVSCFRPGSPFSGATCASEVRNTCVGPKDVFIDGLEKRD